MMYKKPLIMISLLSLLIFITACSGVNMQKVGGQTIIDWVDFINLNGNEYNSIGNGVLSEPSKVKEEIGEVKFKVADNIHDSGYKTKDGDAAFLEKGTKIYAVEGIHDNSIVAVEDSSIVNGYKLYYSRKHIKDYKWHYKDMQIDKINKIEIYYNEDYQTNVLVQQLKGKEMKSFFSVFDSGKTSETFSPSTSNGDPKLFQMVFYSNEVIAYQYNLYYDGINYYWHPWDTSILPKEFEQFFHVGEQNDQY